MVLPMAERSKKTVHVKQMSFRPDQIAVVKVAAEFSGVSEAEIYREAVDRMFKLGEFKRTALEDSKGEP